MPTEEFDVLVHDISKLSLEEIRDLSKRIYDVQHIIFCELVSRSDPTHYKHQN